MSTGASCNSECSASYVSCERGTARIAAARRAAAQLLLSAVQQSIDIDICCKPGPQQQNRRTLLQRADKTDRQTDGQTDAVPLHRPGSARCQ